LRSASWSARLAARFAAAATLSVVVSSVVVSSSARADGIVVGGCVGTRYSITCVKRWGGYGDPYVRLVPSQTEAEKALSADRERKWQARCRPAVVQDLYGIPRYEYAAPGCEFGVIE
jgi:hypothetical protein